MLYKHLFDGGVPYMLLIYILGIMVIALTIYLVYGYIKKGPKDYDKLKKRREIILFLGSLCLLWGIFEQILGMMEIMDCISMVGDISPALIAGGFKATLIAPIYGLIIFLVSFVVWFVARLVHK